MGNQDTEELLSLLCDSSVSCGPYGSHHSVCPERIKGGPNRALQFLKNFDILSHLMLDYLGENCCPFKIGSESVSRLVVSYTLQPSRL